MNKPSLLHTLPLMLLWFFASPCLSHQSDTIDALKSCARMADAPARTACYEELGARLINSESVVPAVADSAPPAQSAIETLPEGLGGGEFADKAGDKAESYRGQVTSCQKSADRKWFYIFDNKQVWKQVDRRSRRHQECNFTVTISKDAFGYIMRIEGQEGKIRVDRHR